MNYLSIKDEPQAKKLSLCLIGFDNDYSAMLRKFLCPPFVISNKDFSLIIASEGSMKKNCGSTPTIIIGSTDERTKNLVYMSRPLNLAALRETALSLACPADYFYFGSEGDYAIDTKNFTVEINHRSASLTSLEFELFKILNERIGEPVSRSEICERLWPDKSGTNICDVYICYLRKKLERIAGKGALLSIRGNGYMLCVPN